MFLHGNFYSHIINDLVMKELMPIRMLLTAILITLALVFIPLSQPAFADADIATGAKVFAANCASCYRQKKGKPFSPSLMC